MLKLCSLVQYSVQDVSAIHNHETLLVCLFVILLYSALRTQISLHPQYNWRKLRSLHLPTKVNPSMQDQQVPEPSLSKKSCIEGVRMGWLWKGSGVLSVLVHYYIHGVQTCRWSQCSKFSPQHQCHSHKKQRIQCHSQPGTEARVPQGCWLRRRSLFLALSLSSCAGKNQGREREKQIETWQCLPH